MSNQILIYKSKKKATIIMFAGLLVALAGWLFLRYTDNEIAGWCFLIFAFMYILFGIGTWLDRKPQIALTATGITDMSGSKQEIEWYAIRQVDDFFYIGQYFMRILIDRSYKPYLNQPTWLYRFDRIYAREGVKAIFMRTSLLEISSSRLYRLVNALMKADEEERKKLISNYTYK